MKLLIIKLSFQKVILAITLFFSSTLLYFSDPASSTEREYLNAKVLLIDHMSGFIGVLLEGESDESRKKMTFRADPTQVYVTDLRGKPLDFTDVQVGDTVELYTHLDEDSHEVVLDIVNYNRSSEF